MYVRILPCFSFLTILSYNIHRSVQRTLSPFVPVRHKLYIMYVCMYVCMYVSVEEYASHLLVSKVTAGLMTDNNPKSAIVMLV